jgi:hypothetical protein
MNLEDQVVSLELAKRLKELGANQGAMLIHLLENNIIKVEDINK